MRTEWIGANRIAVNRSQAVNDPTVPVGVKIIAVGVARAVPDSTPHKIGVLSKITMGTGTPKTTKSWCRSSEKAKSKG